MLTWFAIVFFVSFFLTGLKAGVAKAITNYRSHDPDAIKRAEMRWWVEGKLKDPPKEINWDDFELVVQRVLEVRAEAAPETHIFDLECDVDTIIYRIDRDMSVDWPDNLPWTCANCKHTFSRPMSPCPLCDTVTNVASEARALVSANKLTRKHRKLELKPSRPGATPKTPTSQRLAKIIDDVNHRKAVEAAYGLWQVGPGNTVKPSTSSHKRSGGTDFSPPQLAQLHKLMKMGVISKNEARSALDQQPLEPLDPEAEPEF